MTERLFFDIFSKLNKDDFDSAFATAIVSEVKIQREKRYLIGKVKFNQFLPISTIQQAFANVERLYQLQHLKLDINFSRLSFDDNMWKEIVKFIRSQNRNCNGFLDDTTAILEDDVLRVNLLHGGLSIIKSFKVDEQIKKLVFEWFGINVDVQFTGVTEITENDNDLNEIPLPPPPPTAAPPMPTTPPPQKEPQQTPVRRQAVTVDPAILFKAGDMPFDLNGSEMLKGKKIGESFVKISELTTDSGRVSVVGEIFSFDSRVLWDGKNIRVTLYITDQTGSFVVKFRESITAFEKFEGQLSVGKCIAVSGMVEYDKYEDDIVLQASAIATAKKKKTVDNSKEKRVELHLHTKMSSMDATNDIGDFVKRAAEWGHKAIAITDHGNVQAYPQAASAGKEHGVKILYGMEGYMVDDTVPSVVYGDAEHSFKDTYVVFDIETTGLSAAVHQVIEIGAVKVVGGAIDEEFQTFVCPDCAIPPEIVELTGITDNMVRNAPTFEKAFEQFIKFCGDDSVLVAHNANFDMGFMANSARKIGKEFNYTYIDTVPLCRYAFPGMRSVKLDTVAKKIHLPNFEHHRAVDDAKTLARIFQYLLNHMTDQAQIEDLNGVRNVVETELLQSVHKHNRPYHIILLVKNKIGLKNLYKLVTKGNIEHFYSHPILLKSEISELREGLIIGSACEAGELFKAVLSGKSEEQLLHIADYYDFLEVQPLGNNQYMLRDGYANSKEDLRNFNREIIGLGEKLSKPVCATCDAHFLNKNDEVFRRILQAGQGFDDSDNQPPLYFRSTDEMLAEFDYLSAEKAKEIVITNPNLIAEMCEEIIPIPEGMYPPVIEGCEDELRDIAYANAKRIYGDPIPEIVLTRMERELDAIIGNGFAVMYMISQKLVKKSNEDGYFVGSRGSVGSSFAANIVGISEVNPLPPHYLCPECKYMEWFDDGSIGSGFDLPPKNCPKCGTPLNCDGHDIPFETFLGFKGDKVPDIDLNFSGVYQPVAHEYVRTMFGAKYVYKAGTIGTLADKTAYGFVKKYFEGKGQQVNKAETQRLVNGCMGTKRTTGQHPAGMVVVPKAYDVFDFCPIQHPADDQTSDILTTHFDFHSLHDTILKFDILGHDVPTLLRKMYDLTGIPFETIPMNDPEVYSLLQSPAALGVTPEQIDCETGTLALPEMGTNFVRGMLMQAKPKNFSELLQISGLSHGTDVWIGNAADLIENGTCTISEVIGTRDNIMVYLIHKGMEPSLAFKIMEIVRKGKAKKLLTQEMIDEMYRVGCPEWYVESCMKIKYMFPKAHAAAYVMGAIRLGWYKIHNPLEFYAAHLSVRPDGFDALEVSKGEDYLRNVIKSIENLGKQAKATETEKATTYQVVVEAMARGVEFMPVSIEHSHATDFTVENGKIRMPFSVFSGVGENAAISIAKTRDEGGYMSQEEFRLKSGVSKTIIEIFNQEGVFGDLPPSSQVTFF